MIKVVTATAKDLPTLQDLDLKTYHYPLSDKGWKYALIDSPCKVGMAQIGTTYVGFALFEQADGALDIHRLGVLSKFRGLGAGKTLLQTANALARDLHSLKLRVIVPSCHCENDKDNVSNWLKGQGFRAKGVKTDFFKMYGDLYDGYLFERGVK